MNNESILLSIKKLLGINDEYDVFDSDIILHINTTFATLRQLGVGPSTGFYVQDASTTWADILGDDPRLNLIKSYVYFRVRTSFDPPTSSAAMDAISRQISELEWRINSITDYE